MNVELQNILNQIIAEQSDTILSEPKRVSSFLSDLAREVPKPQKTALIKSLEHGFAKTLKDVPAPERNVCKQKLAQRLNEEEGLELKLCEETLALLAAVLFGERQKKEDNLCKNCGKELQKEWKTCPYCSTPVTKTSQVISPAISSGTGSGKYGTEQIKQATPTFTNNTVNECVGCFYANHVTNKCSYHGMSIYEAAKKHHNCRRQYISGRKNNNK